MYNFGFDKNLISGDTEEDLENLWSVFSAYQQGENKVVPVHILQRIYAVISKGLNEIAAQNQETE